MLIFLPIMLFSKLMLKKSLIMLKEVQHVAIYIPILCTQ